MMRTHLFCVRCSLMWWWRTRIAEWFCKHSRPLHALLWWLTAALVVWLLAEIAEESYQLEMMFAQPPLLLVLGSHPYYCHLPIRHSCGEVHWGGKSFLGSLCLLELPRSKMICFSSYCVLLVLVSWVQSGVSLLTCLLCIVEKTFGESSTKKIVGGSRLLLRFLRQLHWRRHELRW